MGEIISARCSCGYERRELTIGCGMLGKCYVLVWCRGCGRHRSVGEDMLNAGCPKCHTQLTPVRLVYIPDIGNDYDVHYECPVCGQRNLKFDLEALWD